MKQGKILVVDDNKNVLSALKILLNSHFEEVILLSSPTALLMNLREKNPDVVLLDMNYSAGINTGNEGLYWLAEIKKANPDLPVVLFTAYADIDLAVTALKEGASDFVVKPWNNAKLLATLQSALELRLSRKEVARLKEKQHVLNSQLNRESDVYWGESQAMRELLRLVEKVATTDANVLITGENGTGKEVIARKIHQLSPRSNESLVTVDMGAVTETLFESELFGHVKGSFTDAHSDRAGKIEAADKGTLFLDEIGNLSYPLQAKLLNALQSRQIIRVGSNKPVAVDIRLICATNHNLFRDVQDGLFREDLLYRINTIQIEVPPLRRRKEDIPGLASFFLRRFAVKYNKTGITLHKDAIAKMREYAWPGNVRELEHTIEKALILSDNRVIDSSGLFLRPTAGSEKDKQLDNVTLEEMERVLIERAMRNYGNNISAIAKELGVSRPTLYSKIKKYGL
ncbi:sigma-54 dependent transcriptional regulator [Proteiniphilum sp. X52]|uniref:sigma-54-dependent transcriptional regulator n=1 Tax=Proteiniphilum sp. X52 TaxID=2382159 RepID=UPI000F0A1B05|nr:sigma-54 dependent transcriptional regulator [Proteiniphilum sp. X52]RNC64224.1 sigma-54-dependent Fis family transcriptional regulator [Proteiniphilum sp. X52]